MSFRNKQIFRDFIGFANSDDNKQIIKQSINDYLSYKSEQPSWKQEVKSWAKYVGVPVLKMLVVSYVLSSLNLQDFDMPEVEDFSNGIIDDMSKDGLLDDFGAGGVLDPVLDQNGEFIINTINSDSAFPINNFRLDFDVWLLGGGSYTLEDLHFVLDDSDFTLGSIDLGFDD